MWRNIIKGSAAAVALAVVLLAGGQARAFTLTYGLNYEFSGATSPASANSPWLTATFTDGGLLPAGTVRLEMSATNLTGTEYVDDWYFNFDPAKNPTLLTFTYVSGFVAQITKTADNTNSIAADGGGYYDIKFDFPQSAANRFGVGGSSIYDITFASTGLTAADFNFLSAPHGGNGTWHSAAHVQSIAGGGSGYIGDKEEGGGPHEVVPEPGTIMLLGTGLIGLALYGRRRMK